MEFEEIVAALRADEKESQKYMFTPRWSDILEENYMGSDMQQNTQYQWKALRRKGVNDYGRRPSYERIRPSGR